MDYFLPKTDAVVSPSMVSYFTIYDPSLIHKDTQDACERGIMVLLPQDERIDTQARMRKIGMIQGMSDFACSYTSEPLEFVELDNQRVVVVPLEDKFVGVLCVELGRVEDEGKTEYSDQDVAPVQFLRRCVVQGYNDFRLHNGSIDSLCGSMDYEEVTMFLQKWWSVWLSQFQLQLNQNGVLSMFDDGVRRSLLKCDSEISDTVDEMMSKHGFKECLVWCGDKTNYENYGLVYEHSKTLQMDSKLRLLHWLEETDHYGLTPQAASQPVVMKNQTTDDDDPDNTKEQVYDPFKLVWSTLGDVSNATGITSGVDAGIKTLTEGVSMMGHGAKAVTSYVPWFGKQVAHDSPVEEEEAQEGSTTMSSQSLDVVADGFLIGKIGDVVLFKNVYLSFEEEKLHRVVIWKNGDFVVVLIYEFKVNTLNESSYYDGLSLELMRLMKKHFPELNEEGKNFYYIGFDKETHVIESNLPNIALDYDDGDSNDSKFFYDLSVNRAHGMIIHKELLMTLDFINRDQELEKLFRTRNGWWCYNHKGDTHEVIIVKKWKFYKNDLTRQNLLETSANIVATIGDDAKKWLDEYLERFTK